MELKLLGLLMLLTATGTVWTLVITDLSRKYRNRPSQNRLASQIEFDRSPATIASIAADVMASRHRVVHVRDNDLQTIHLNDARYVYDYVAASILSGESVHLALAHMREWAASTALDTVGLHNLLNFTPGTIDECGIYGLDYYLHSPESWAAYNRRKRGPPLMWG
jgi:hypothetical protein